MSDRVISAVTICDQGYLFTQIILTESQICNKYLGST